MEKENKTARKHLRRQSRFAGHSARHCRFPRVLVSNIKDSQDVKTDDSHSMHRKSKASKLNRLSDKRPSGITKVIHRSDEEVSQSRSEHASQLENIYHKRHVLPSIIQRQKKRQRESSQTQKQTKHKNDNSKKENPKNKIRYRDEDRNQIYNSNDDAIIEEVEDDDGEDDEDEYDSISIPTSGTPDGLLTPTSHDITSTPQTPEATIVAATPSQFLRPASQNFGIHRSSLKQTEDALAPILAAREAHQKKMKKKQNHTPKVFIEVARLEPGDVFGLEQVVMGDMDDVTATSLVSDGAEVVIIEKKFFQKHLTEETAKRMRQTIRPLPSDSVLQQNLIDQRHWDAYKSRTLETQAKLLVRSKLLNHAFRA